MSQDRPIDETTMFRDEFPLRWCLRCRGITDLVSAYVFRCGKNHKIKHKKIVFDMRPWLVLYSISHFVTLSRENWCNRVVS